MSTNKNAKPAQPKVTREEFWVRVDGGENAAGFHKATQFVGRTMPFTKPRATLAMQVTDDVVAFSLLHLTKANASTVAAKPIEIPKGPLRRLARRAALYADMGNDELIVELSTRSPRPDSVSGDSVSGDRGETAPPPPAAVLADLFDAPADADTPTAADGPTSNDAPDLAGDGDAPAAGDPSPDADAASDATAVPRKRPQRPSVIESWRYHLRRDANSVITLESVDDEHVFTLPRGALHVSVYLRSPHVNRMLAVSFIGHLGRSDSTETMGRVAAMVLNSMSHLHEFRMLADVETAVVPAAPSGGAGPARQPQVKTRAAFTTQVYLFDAQMAPVGSGVVGVEFDLMNANPSSGRLLTHVTPEGSLAEQWPAYAPIFDQAIAKALAETMTEADIAEISYDIILGGVTDSTAERLAEVGAKATAIDLNPTAFRDHV